MHRFFISCIKFAGALAGIMTDSWVWVIGDCG